MICRQLMLEDHTKWEHSRAYASRTLSALSGPERIGKSAHGLQGSPRWQVQTRTGTLVINFPGFPGFPGRVGTLQCPRDANVKFGM
ncbi:uncharacterized protein si:ch73-234b20.5 isoform X3 [Tachysurus vachellii]|uniref:uncharacterized protein si:ch73-234b20.5 isoform X3 n=1 Tax=Tachysurus vachellii TaxID=175792 RepID=UPI00296B0021|nr:uncharacterized protein si:ch73-234b20.5 isoform X3 [Tachysurus vachellii]